MKRVGSYVFFFLVIFYIYSDTVFISCLESEQQNLNIQVNDLKLSIWCNQELLCTVHVSAIRNWRGAGCNGSAFPVETQSLPVWYSSAQEMADANQVSNSSQSSECLRQRFVTNRASFCCALMFRGKLIARCPLLQEGQRFTPFKKLSRKISRRKLVFVSRR